VLVKHVSRILCRSCHCHCLSFHLGSPVAVTSTKLPSPLNPPKYGHETMTQQSSPEVVFSDDVGPSPSCRSNPSESVRLGVMRRQVSHADRRVVYSRHDLSVLSSASYHIRLHPLRTIDICSSAVVNKSPDPKPPCGKPSRFWFLVQRHRKAKSR
jgi:hypothetical protein